MAARYVRIGQYPDYRDEIRGTLLEILASTTNPGTYAVPEDVAGCTLEMGGDGLWTGNLGTLTQAQADALVAAGVMGNVKTGTPGSIAETLYTWRAGEGGWKSIKAKRTIIAPYNQAFEYTTVSVAYGFTERFKAPQDAVGFDVVWYSCAGAGTLVKAAWGRVGNLVGSYQQQTPSLLKISGVDISNATIPAGAGYLPASILVCDFVNTKISAGDIIEIRSNTSGAGRGYIHTTRGSDSYVYGGGDVYASEASGGIGGTGDCITGNPLVNCATGTSVGVCMIRWYSQTGVISVIECGDSITKGEAGFEGQTGVGNIAPLHLATAINPAISPIVLGHGGNPSTNFHASAISLIPVFKPSAIVIPAWSPNDGVGGLNVSINRALQVCAVAIENGVVPLLKTPNPWSYAGADLTAWQAGVAR